MKKKKTQAFTHSSTTRNLSPSEAMHLPRKLNVEPLIDTGCWLPLRNHEPSQRLGNTHPKKGNRMQILLKCPHNHIYIYVYIYLLPSRPKSVASRRHKLPKLSATTTRSPKVHYGEQQHHLVCIASVASSSSFAEFVQINYLTDHNLLRPLTLSFPFPNYH